MVPVGVFVTCKNSRCENYAICKAHLPNNKRVFSPKLIVRKSLSIYCDSFIMEAQCDHSWACSDMVLCEYEKDMASISRVCTKCGVFSSITVRPSKYNKDGGCVEEGRGSLLS